jgi:hypothetical protein
MSCSELYFINIVTFCVRQYRAITTHALNRASIQSQQEQELVTMLCCHLLRMFGQHFIKHINPPRGQERVVSLVEAVIIRSQYKCSCPWRPAACVKFILTSLINFH